MLILINYNWRFFYILLAFACFPITSKAETASKTITIIGQIDPCYDFEHGVVYLTAIPTLESFKLNPSQPPHLVSPIIPMSKDGHFKIVLPADQVPYGRYIIGFGEKKDVPSGGGMAVEIHSDFIDVGEPAGCDV